MLKNVIMDVNNVTMDVNNCTNSTNISLSVEEYLNDLQDKHNITMIPAVIFMSILSCIGLVGNILVLLVYSQKMRLNPTKVLLMTIASFDLVANVGAIPSEINVMLHAWNFKNPGVCKSKVFLGSFTTIGGALSLIIVAVIRFRKVCRPYGWQVSITHAKIGSLIAAIVGFLYSIPYMIIYGIKTRNTPCTKIKGYECFADDYYHDTIWPLLNNLMFILFFISTSLSLVVLYVLIGITAWKHSRLHGVHESVKTKNVDNSSTPISSTDRELSASQDLPNDQPLPVLRVNTVQTKRDQIKSLLCCFQLPEGKTKPSNITKITITSTDNDLSDNSVEMVNREKNENISNNFSWHLKVPPNSRVTNFPESSSSFSTDTVLTDTSEDSEKMARGKTYRNDGQIEISSDIVPSDDEQKSHKVTSDAKRDKKSRREAEQKLQRRRPLGRMTVMLIIISAIYIFGFFPFLALTIFKNRFPMKYLSLNAVEFTFYNFFYRLYFLNSAANPVIYSLCDINFRKECIRLLTCRSRRWSFRP